MVMPHGYLISTIGILFSLMLHDVLSACPAPHLDFTIPNSNLSGLCCPDWCEQEKTLIKKCCQCNSEPFWSPLSDLYIEYTTSRGWSKVLTSDGIIQKHYMLIHNNGQLSAIPSNICEFKDQLKVVDFQNNFIKEINTISCLNNLDTLNLNGNLISRIYIHTFRGMSMLRELNIENNNIIDIEPNALADPSLSTLIMRFGFNKLTEIDVTNVVLERPFCDNDFSNNPASKITNKENYQLDEKKKYGDGGMVNFRNTNFTSSLNFTELGVPDLRLLGKIFSFGFDFVGANWTCDCKMVPYMKLAESVLHIMWRDYFNIKCAYPAELAGQSIPMFIREKRLDLFICNITTLQGCPVSCHCYRQTSKDRIVVNCTSKEMPALPSAMPNGENLEIYLQGNKIKSLEARSYLDRTNVLDVANNDITKLNDNVLNTLSKRNASINLKGNPSLTKLTKTIQNMDYCAINVGTITLVCNCDTLWIGQWVRNRKLKSCQHQNKVICSTSVGNVSAEDFTAITLDCVNDTVATTLAVTLIAVTVLVVVCIELIRRFRYEIFIMQRELRKGNRNSIHPLVTYDAYISISESLIPLNAWIRTTFVPSLEQSGYKMCLPSRDFVIGSVRQDEIIKNISLSRHVVVVLSDDHLYLKENIWSRMEWKHTWEAYCSGSVEKIILINYDYVNSGDTTDMAMKAFLRLSMFLDFSNHKLTLMEDLKRLLGNPFRSGTGDINPNVRFNPKVFDLK